MEQAGTATAEAKQFFDENGYFVSHGLFSPNEVEEMRDHYMEMRKEGPKPGDSGGDPEKGDADPLNAFPRFINMHDWDEKTDAWQRDPRFRDTAVALLEDNLELSQTMLYFKPPGSRGQGLHQDNQYLRRHPVVAAWLALDPCDAANGQMVLVPGSHKDGVLPVQFADKSLSFTTGETVMPKDAEEVGIDMDGGDVLFFGGFTIHGSYPNETTDRFRRTFIVHYYGAEEQMLPDDPARLMSGLQRQST